jgi:hypothetical protein
MKYIIEFQKYKSGTTSSGRTKYIDTIWDDPTSSKSQSASVVLRNKLKDLEDAETRDELGDLPDWVLRKIKSNPDKYEKIKVTINNLKFLKDRLTKDGELSCEYCGKGPLIIYDFNMKSLVDALDNPNMRFNTKFNPFDGATCDHKVPQSKGGDKFNYSNLAVSCHRCNRKKGNMDYEDWLYFLNSDKGKEWINMPNEIKKTKEIERKSIERNPVKISSFKQHSRDYDNSDFKVGDEVWVKGLRNKLNKYLGVISDIRVNERHPEKKMAASIEGKDPNSLYILDRLCKFK